MPFLQHSASLFESLVIMAGAVLIERGAQKSVSLTWARLRGAARVPGMSAASKAVQPIPTASVLVPLPRPPPMPSRQDGSPRLRANAPPQLLGAAGVGKTSVGTALAPSNMKLTLCGPLTHHRGSVLLGARGLMPGRRREAEELPADYARQRFDFIVIVVSLTSTLSLDLARRTLAALAPSYRASPVLPFIVRSDAR